MIAKQLSVFIENREGRLCEVLEALKNNNVNILSLSLADTTEYGLLRLIVGNPEVGRNTLVDAGFSSMLTDVLVIKVPHKSGSLQGLIGILAKRGINIEYMYGLSIEGETAYIVIKVSDMNAADKIINESGAKTLSCEDVAKELLK